MTHYSDSPGNVRVDYFKPSGKWYMTRELNMYAYYNTSLIHDAIRSALIEQGIWLPHFTMVILEPYHQHAHPIMFVAESDA